MSRTRVVVVLFVLLGGCMGRFHYQDRWIVDPPAEDRKLLFDREAATAAARKAVARKYDFKPITWTGTVMSIDDTGSVITWPLRLHARVCPGPYRIFSDCEAAFDGGWREELVKLRCDDRVTIVGRVLHLNAADILVLGACELIRAERDGKVIYPPVGEQKDAEGEKKP